MVENIIGNKGLMDKSDENDNTFMEIYRCL